MKIFIFTETQQRYLRRLSYNVEAEIKVEVEVKVAVEVKIEKFKGKLILIEN